MTGATQILGRSGYKESRPTRRRHAGGARSGDFGEQVWGDSGERHHRRPRPTDVSPAGRPAGARQHSHPGRPRTVREPPTTHRPPAAEAPGHARSLLPVTEPAVPRSHAQRRPSTAPSPSSPARCSTPTSCSSTSHSPSPAGPHLSPKGDVLPVGRFKPRLEKLNPKIRGLEFVATKHYGVQGGAD